MSSDQFRARAVVPSTLGGQFPPSTATMKPTRLDSAVVRLTDQNDRVGNIAARLDSLRRRLGVEMLGGADVAPPHPSPEAALDRLDMAGAALASRLTEVEHLVTALEQVA